ncbi:replication protein H [Halobacteriales archaeon QS_1_67_19]|nr:MAG: replication protein H [Halobacteriales archaeon QS_1_67_19]
MYAVVGCSDCGALKIVEGRPETTQCPRCGKRRKFEKLRKFVETDDEDHAREVRASMLANRQDEGEAFAELDSFAEMEARVEDAGIDDDEYLEASGVDTDEVAAAAERVEDRSASTRGTSRKETVLAALRELDRPTEDEVVAYAGERGVPDDYVRDALEKLTRRGEVSESRGRYRLL